MKILLPWRTAYASSSIFSRYAYKGNSSYVLVYETVAHPGKWDALLYDEQNHSIPFIKQNSKEEAQIEADKVLVKLGYILLKENDPLMTLLE